MDLTTTLNSPAERRKQVRLRVRPDLQIFVFSLFDGRHTMEEVQKSFEEEFKPQRLEHNDLEGFARQLVTAGLVQNEQPGAGKHLFHRRAKQRRLRRLASVTNILYLKLPVFDPDRILTWMFQYLWWIFTTAFFVLSVLFMLSAAVH